jgi:hypothetical protein
MKTIKNLSRPILYFIAVISLAGFYSCEDKLPSAMDTSSKFTDLKSIKILNAGAAGNVVLQGEIDEVNKTVSFPRLDPATDFDNIKFEAELSEGASLDKEVYSFDFQPGESESSVLIGVNNLPRFKRYSVKLRQRVPVFGADFTKPTVYDFSGNEAGQPVYAPFVGGFTRGTGFDGEHVVVMSREPVGGQPSHLLKYSDLKAGNVSPINLNATGIAGGFFTTNGAAQIKGHTYAANMTLNITTGPLIIYHWSNPANPPQVIASISLTAADVGTVVRFGDVMSVNIDDSGNGFMFFTANAGTRSIRVTVTNFTTISDPQVLTTPASLGIWTSVNKFGDDYIITGTPYNFFVGNDRLASNLTITAGPELPLQALDPKVVLFNGERYLITTTGNPTTGGTGSVLYVYDLTRGATIREALVNFQSSGKVPIYKFSIGGTPNGFPLAFTDYAVIKNSEGKDDKLVLYTAAPQAGFALIEFPIKVAIDD